LKNSFLAIASLLIILFVIGYFYLKQRQKIKEKDIELQRLKDVFEGQEIIKQGVSKDLHDIIATRFDGIRLKILALPKAKNPELVSESIIKEINEVNDQARLISHRLSPLGNKLKKTTLNKIIRAQLSEFQHYRGVFINVQLPFPEELDKMNEDAQTNFYGIILECLSNVEKHSQATEIKILHQTSENQLIFNITDNGIGFKSKKEEEKGIGLINIQNRTKLLNGVCEFESSNLGTKITLTIPIKINTQ
jgi:signal transduction histidine kinase